jgi:hypothetical protein
MDVWNAVLWLVGIGCAITAGEMTLRERMAEIEIVDKMFNESIRFWTGGPRDGE